MCYQREAMKRRRYRVDAIQHHRSTTHAISLLHADDIRLPVIFALLLNGGFWTACS